MYAVTTAIKIAAVADEPKPDGVTDQTAEGGTTGTTAETTTPNHPAQPDDEPLPDEYLTSHRTGFLIGAQIGFRERRRLREELCYDWICFYCWRFSRVTVQESSLD